MKIFATSDIHGYFDIFKESLDKSGFEENNPNHLLVICGDYFDRGAQPFEVMQYLMSINNKVLVKGNHETLFEKLCHRGFPEWYDYSNGTSDTVQKLSGCELGTDFQEVSNQAYLITKDFREGMINYFETKNYIFVHSWVPFSSTDKWRDSSDEVWELSAMWGNPFLNAKDGLNTTGKWIVHGHFHNSYYWHNMKNIGSEFDEDACFDTVVDEKTKTIGLDACTAHSKKCNILIIEDDLIEKGEE